MRKAGLVWIAALCFCIAGAVIPARAQTTTCSNATLNGNYDFNGNGLHIVLDLLNVIALEQHVEAAGSLTLDGNGNVTVSNVEVLVDGQSNADADVGTYTMNPDCTGTLTLNDPIEPLTYDIAAQEVDPTTGIANGFAGLDNADQLDLDIIATLNSGVAANATKAAAVLPKAAANASCYTFAQKALVGRLKGGTGSEVDSAIVSLELSSSAGKAQVGFVGRKINGVSVPKSTSPIIGTYTVNADCSIQGSASDGSTTYTFTAAPLILVPVQGGVSVDQTTLTVTDGTRGLAGEMKGGFSF